jgi:starch synthase
MRRIKPLSALRLIRTCADGAARARERFDWKVVVRAYEELWQELTVLKNAGQPAPSPEALRDFWPARPDPFDLFASFPSTPFSSQQAFSQTLGVSEAEVLERLSLKASLVNASKDISADFLLAVWKLADGRGATLQDVLAAHQNTQPALAVRALLWLTKLGLLRVTP